MMLIRKFIFVLLVNLLIRSSFEVVPKKKFNPLVSEKPSSESESDQSEGEQENDSSGDPDLFGKATKTFTDFGKTLLDTFNKGFDLFKTNSDSVTGKLQTLVDKGVTSLNKLEESTKVPLRALTSMASSKMDYFESPGDAKEKMQQLNDVMSKYLSENKVELPENMKNSKLLQEKYLNSYKGRCLQGDCFTLDNVKVSGVNNKLNLMLPRLSQVNFAFELFKQSGVEEKNDFLKTLMLKKNYNSLDYFTELLGRHNLEGYEFLNKNDEALNHFYYKATLLFKKFTAESRFKNHLDSSKTLTTVLGFFVKGNLMEIAQVATYNNVVTLDPEELEEVNKNYKNYLSNDCETFAYLSDAYGNMCKECLMGTSDDNKANKEMLDYLVEGKFEVNDICDDQGEDCMEMLDKYLERCKSGDCYTFDNVSLTKRVRLKVFLPNIPQAKLAMRIFKNSKAHRGHHVIGLFKKLLRMETHKTLMHFVKMLTKHNVQMCYYNNDAEKVLNQFLYQGTLFFVRFLTVSRLVSFYSLGKLTLYFFSLGRNKYLKKLAKSVTFGNKVVLAGENLSILMEDYKEYLVNNNKLKHQNISKYYADMCKNVILHNVTADKMSTDMFDAGSDVKPEDVCGKSENLDCSAFVKVFLERCKKGDCYTLDTKDFFTSDRMYKLTLPILHQVDAAIYVFKNSKAYGNYVQRLVNSVGPKKKIDSYVQFYRNLVNHNNKYIVTKTFENEVLNKYLYNSAVYFKFVSDNKVLDNIDVNYLQEYKNTEHKIESFLKRMLKFLVGAERVRFSNVNLKNVFELYGKYFRNTQVVKDDNGMKMFLESCQKIFKMFKEMQNDDKMYLKYLQYFDHD